MDAISPIIVPLVLTNLHLINIMSFYFSKKKKYIYIYIYMWVPEDEVEKLQHWCGNAMGHKPKKEGHPRRGRDESKYFGAFQVGTRI